MPLIRVRTIGTDSASYSAAIVIVTRSHVHPSPPGDTGSSITHDIYVILSNGLVRRYERSSLELANTLGDSIAVSLHDANYRDTGLSNLPAGGYQLEEAMVNLSSLFTQTLVPDTILMSPTTWYGALGELGTSTPTKVPPADKASAHIKEDDPLFRYSCPLCNNMMEKKSGRYGTFWSCTQWKKTGCNATLGVDGKPGKQTQALIKQREEKKREAEEIAAIGQTLGTLEIE